MEDLLKKLVEGLERIEIQQSAFQEEVRNNFDEVRNDIKNMNSDIKNMKTDIQEVKASVQKMEQYQENVIMSMLVHIKKQVDIKENQMQVLNRRLFDVEAKIEQMQQ